LEKEEKTEENLVKKTCRELGITQKELAEKIGVNPKTISDWTVGRLQITPATRKLLNLLVIEKDYNKLLNTIENAISQRKTTY
jgi:DNA-binding XRE family transcriptional regulator